MSNNKLYLRVKGETEVCFLAKSFGADWSWRATPEEIDEFLKWKAIYTAIGMDDQCELEVITDNQLPEGVTYWKPKPREAKPWWKFWT